MSTRILSHGDEAVLEDFLIQQADTSMFVRSNMRAAGLVDEVKPYQGTYAAQFEGDRIVGVASHNWNGYLLLQNATSDVINKTILGSTRPLAGFVGPRSEVVAAPEHLGLKDNPTCLDSKEDLFALDLDYLVVPPLLNSSDVVCQHPTEDDLDLLCEWRVAYRIEALGAKDSPGLREEMRKEMRRSLDRQVLWLLLHERELVALSGFNAQLPDCIQIGGVWTPPALRSRGYGRAVVAGSLLHARSEGVERSILFTDDDNITARKAYLALG